MGNQELTVDNRRGTVLWGIYSLRADGLSRLLDDLVDLETKGLLQHECKQVQAALTKIAGRAAAVPDGSFWRSQIYREFEVFAELYEEWNSREGPSEEAIGHRKRTLKKLRHQRNKLATRIRRNQFVLQNELDLMLVEGMYTALRDLTTSLPEIFKGLAEAVARYDLRKNP